MSVTPWNFNHPEKIVLQELLLVKADLHRAKQCIQLCLGPPYLASHAPGWRGQVLHYDILVCQSLAIQNPIAWERPSIGDLHNAHDGDCLLTGIFTRLDFNSCLWTDFSTDANGCTASRSSRL